MQLTIKGRHLDISDALHSRTADRLTEVFDKYFGGAITADVIFSKEGNLFRVVVQAHIGRNIELSAHGEAEDAYNAIDLATEHLGKRLRRYKRRLKNHHQNAASKEINADSVRQLVLAEAEEDSAHYDGDTPHESLVIAETTTKIMHLTVSEAVMRLDLTNDTAMLFKNQANGEINLVYRRPDGNVGWIDPSLAPTVG